MARSFSGSAQYLEYATAPPITAAPLTFAAWFNKTGTGTSKYLGGIADKDTNNHHFNFNISTANKVQATCNDGSGAVSAVTSTTITAATWMHAAAVFTSSTSRTAYLNGGGSGSETTSRTPSAAALDNMCIGCVHLAAGYFGPFDGLIAEWGLWNVDLDAAEIAALAAGVCPLLVRPTSLVAYYPLIGNNSPETDVRSAYAMTVTGATAAAHPRIYYQNKKAFYFSPPSSTASVGSSTGTSTVTVVGASLASAVGAVTATSTVSGVDASLAAAVGASVGVVTVSGVGASLAASVVSVAGTSTVSGIGAALAAADGLVAGTSTVNGVGTSLDASTGTIVDTSTVSGGGVSLAAAAGSISGTSTVSGVGASRTAAVGVSAGTSTISGIGASLAAVIGSSVGTSAVNGVGTSSSGATQRYSIFGGAIFRPRITSTTIADSNTGLSA